MHDIEDRIRTSRPDDRQVMLTDVDQLVSRGRRRRAAVRVAGASAAGLVAIAGAMAVTQAQITQPIVNSDVASAPSATASETEPVDVWTGMSVQEAASRLIGIVEQHPEQTVPPSAGTVELRTVYLTQARRPAGVEEWDVTVRTMTVGGDRANASDWGRTAALSPSDTDMPPSEWARQLAAGEFQLDVTGRDDGFTWGDADWRNEMLDQVDASLAAEGGGLYPESVATAALHRDTRIDLLQLLARHPDVVEFTGTTTDVDGRTAVGFTTPLPRDEDESTEGAVVSAPPWDPDATATIYLSPTTGQILGWQYGGPIRDWRLEAIHVQHRE